MAMVTSGFNAKRFAGKPLNQPIYSFKDIPRCAKDLQYSSLQELNDREQVNGAMAEMVLLCNETMRRLHIEQKVGKRTAKPLSLEYIADRNDIDDPLFGFLVRTETRPPHVNDETWKRGMLQGFITVTTFTNWQKTFRWDSMHDSAFAYDDEALAEAMQSGVRRYDEDGSLAQALQSTVRCGDPWNEGIVWPRIAEISLLGGMGCGKALVSLVIEKLERMKPSCKQNYDYVALQATENSIPFYESLGFVRVGAISEDDKYEEKQAKLRGEEPPTPSSPDSAGTPQSEIVSGPVDVYVTKVKGETPVDVAKKLNVDVWDIIFLNHFVYPDINTRSRLMAKTSLYVPAAEDAQEEALSRQPIAPQWYIAEENDTLRMIARQFNVNCTELVDANKGRLPGLQWQSRLKEGTRIKVSHFHIDDDKHVPYCHWTFPDDSFETSEPSYMMVRKLNRQKGSFKAARHMVVESSLAVPISKFTAPPSELFHVVKPASVPSAKKTPKSNKKRKLKEPEKPKRPGNAFMLYCSEQRELRNDEFAGKTGPAVMKVLSKVWKELPESEKAPYQEKYAKELTKYHKAMENHKKELASFHEARPELDDSLGNDDSDATSQTLINKVVKLKGDEEREHEYYFVLTYIPDLCWAHLAPLECVGTWGPDKPKAEGRPIWMLVDESEGKEVDISGSMCVPVRSRAMKRTADADCEQWDILEPDDTARARNRKIRPRTKGIRAQRQSQSGTKPLASVPTKKKQGSGKKRGRPRKHPFPEPSNSEKNVPKKRGRPSKQQHSATKPLSGSIQPKKKNRGTTQTPRKNSLLDTEAGHPSPLTGFVKPKRGRPRMNSLPEAVDAAKPAARGRGRPPRQAVSSMSTAVGGKKLDLDLGIEDDEIAEKPKRRGRASSASGFSATKPLSGSIERKKRKRRSSKSSVKNPSTDSKDEEARLTKRRRLPRRDSRPSAGYQDVENSDVDMDNETPVKAPPVHTRKRRPRTASSDFTGASPRRTVALTRTAKKLSMTSPLMFSPRRALARV